MKPYLFFDAGGTVIFPDFARVAGALESAGRTTDPDALFRAFGRALYEADLPPEAAPPGGFYPRGFYAALLERVGVPPAEATRLGGSLREDPAELGWAATFPWVEAALHELRGQGYRMSVISNSDGRVAERLAHAGLDGYFDRIYDSALVGYEKPDPRIFQQALDELDLAPSECLHVGDLYHFDVLGANRAGVAAILLDPFGLSSGRPGLRIPTVADYPRFLAGIDGLAAPAFHPLAGR
ncbi:HAD family hydrolase [Limnochorda pilosa]|uniref:HAD family hydrolase n=1 Tax=Limnochorda pilosa TaxID=1555112 RepID=A0A0K2SMM4_LIMPI|nr:HAD-IA family hydrolase [Limnochorda pilosa]BAS28252.1 HAD family hydrolase [Limnochorda pilosa]